MSLKILSPSEQLADFLRDEMLKGRWAGIMPGTPTLADEYGVDRKTVTAALGILNAEGLLETQGIGRNRRITLSAKDTRCLNIHVILYEENDQQILFISQMLDRMRIVGYNVHVADRSLLGMRMDVRRVARYVMKNPADAWIVFSGSRQVLEWFANQNTPAFAIFGRRRQVSIPSVGPDKEQAIRTVVQRLVQLGHRDIVYLAREERRKPNYGFIEQCYIDELMKQGIAINLGYILPDWNDDKESFHECLDSLYQHSWSPPTAIILDESHFYMAALLHFSHMGLVVPRDVSLISSDSQVVFDWCEPEVSHISWDGGAIVDRVLQWMKQLSRRRGVLKKAHYTSAEFIEGGTIGPASSID